MRMDYNTSWTISTVAKLVTAALERTGQTGVYILAGGVIAGAYIGYKKIRSMEDRINQLEWRVKFGGGL